VIRPWMLFALAVAGCSSTAESEIPEPAAEQSAGARYRGYEAVQNHVRSTLIDPSAPFELHAYLGANGETLSYLLGRSDGFGVQYELVNATPNPMNMLVWRLMMSSFANDLAASCPGATRPSTMPEAPLVLDARARPIVHALCAWPADDAAIGAAWDLVMGHRAPRDEREPFIAYARALGNRSAADALPSLWSGIFLHAAYLLDR
jgi:hypothetical protein